LIFVDHKVGFFEPVFGIFCPSPFGNSPLFPARRQIKSSQKTFLKQIRNKIQTASNNSKNKQHPNDIIHNFVNLN
jgi:hypothetical protein